MMDDILKGMLRRGFRGKREVATKEFKGNLRWVGKEIAKTTISEGKRRGLVKSRNHGWRLELIDDLFK